MSSYRSILDLVPVELFLPRIMVMNSVVWTSLNHNLLDFITTDGPCLMETSPVTVDGFIFVGTNFRGSNENDTFVGFNIYMYGQSIFLHNSY